MTADSGHRLALGDGWSVWRDFGLRSAGFPAHEVSGLCDHRVADAAARAANAPADRVEFQRAYSASASRQSAVLAGFARDPRYREALALQNLGLLDSCLDKLVAEIPGKGARRRQRELVLARYVQRYALKNDTISFFGPFAWARVTERDEAIAVEVGPRLLASRPDDRL